MLQECISLRGRTDHFELKMWFLKCSNLASVFKIEYFLFNIKHSHDFLPTLLKFQGFFLSDFYSGPHVNNYCTFP